MSPKEDRELCTLIGELNLDQLARLMAIDMVDSLISEHVKYCRDPVCLEKFRGYLERITRSIKQEAFHLSEEERWKRELQKSRTREIVTAREAA